MLSGYAVPKYVGAMLILVDSMHCCVMTRSIDAARGEKRSLLEVKTELLCGVFRRLIIGSGLQWANDRHLVSQLIKLGKFTPNYVT